MSTWTGPRRYPRCTLSRSGCENIYNFLVVIKCKLIILIKTISTGQQQRAGQERGGRGRLESKFAIQLHIFLKVNFSK